MRRATVAYAIYMLLGGIGVILLALYVQAYLGVLVGLVIMALAAVFCLVEKRSQGGGPSG